MSEWSEGERAMAEALPAHLRRYVVAQDYARYSAQEHATWRTLMRKLVRVLEERAHPIYLEGLRRTGIGLEAIPRIDEMNRILSRLGWGAVTVDGFIPPAAFMEFQARKVLVITAQIRKPEHLEYTPAPDIVHEAAGHAPIIADPTYARYLARFGEVGSMALASGRDEALFEAIRRLSHLKELPEVPPHELEEAEARVLELQRAAGEPSELTRLSRLHWWTVEYGLVGSPGGSTAAPKLYGAGLLSSIGEAVSCLDPAVAKLPLDLGAAERPYDITTRQPQLYVAESFEQLDEVLERLAATMAFRLDGRAALARAIESGCEATARFSSGLQVSGHFAEMLTGQGARLAWVRTAGPTALAFGERALPGHGPERHPEGFSSPVGRLVGQASPLERMSDSDLARAGLALGEVVQLRFESGVALSGKLERVERRLGKVVLLTFSSCEAHLGTRQLYSPAWGLFDMAVGEAILQVRGGPADREALAA